MRSDYEIARNFLSIFFPPELLPLGNVLLKEFQPGGGAVVCSKNALAEYLRRNEELKTKLGFCTSLRKKTFIPKEQKHGGKVECTATCFQKLDFDGTEIVQNDERVKVPLTGQEKEKVRRELLDAPFRPTIIVDSGGGIHAYYKLDKPYVFSSAQSIVDFELVTQKMISYFKAKNLPGEVDDSIKDISRIMRLPGSINFRYEEPCLVKIIEVVE